MVFYAYIQSRPSSTAPYVVGRTERSQTSRLCNDIDPELLRTQNHYRWVGNKREFVTMGSLLDRQTCVLCEAACEQATINRMDVSHRRNEEAKHIYWQDLLDKLSSFVQKRLTDCKTPLIVHLSGNSTVRVATALEALHRNYTTWHSVYYIKNRTQILNTENNFYGNWEHVLMPVSTCSSKGCESTSYREKVPLLEMFNSSDGIILMPRHGKYPTEVFSVAIPEDIAFTLTLLDDNPTAWWTGQFMKYFFSPAAGSGKRVSIWAQRGFSRNTGPAGRQTKTWVRVPPHRGVHWFLQ